PYAARTGRWIIGSAGLFAWAWGQSQGESRWLALAGAGAVLAFGIYRIVWQAGILKRIKALPPSAD
ncbi:MAG: hypothetical protein ACI9WU_001174, partial [Myxococcota bacterium]